MPLHNSNEALQGRRAHAGIKNQVAKTLASMGFTGSEAVRVFITRADRWASAADAARCARTRDDTQPSISDWSQAVGGKSPVAEYVGGLGFEGAERLREAVRLAYLDGEADGPRSYAATAWVVKGTVP